LETPVFGKKSHFLNFIHRGGVIHEAVLKPVTMNSSF